MGVEIQTLWAQVLVPLLTVSVTLGKLLDPSVPLFSYLGKEDENIKWNHMKLLIFDHFLLKKMPSSYTSAVHLLHRASMRMK